MILELYKKELLENGFTVINDIFSTEEVEQIISVIESADSTKSTFRKSADLFAIRQFLKEIPAVQKILLNDKLRDIIYELFGKNYFITKSIYFDKPEQSNWFVAYHQDLTISVDKKIELKDFGSWTTKQNQFSVQPPIEFLESNFTIRVHLDNTNENNGALKVISNSHTKGIYRADSINWETEKESICTTLKGGIMIMRPLLLHSSSRTINNSKRRVIHIEFSDRELNSELNWSERLNLK